MNKILISAIVVCYNEGKILKRCLESLQSCDEIIVVDLGSSDDSVTIANIYSTKTIKHDWVPIGEVVREKVSSLAKNDWIFFVDPDEEIPPSIFPQLNQVIVNNREISMISLQGKFYFLGKPLNSTVWGQVSTMYRVLHRNRVIFDTSVHSRPISKEPFVIYDLVCDDFVKHYWVDSIGAMVEKHWRYIKLEGKARYGKGNRFNFFNTLNQFIENLDLNLRTLNGKKDGVRGVFLSFFYSFYHLLSDFSLLIYQVKPKIYKH